MVLFKVFVVFTGVGRASANTAAQGGRGISNGQ